jgi:histidinol-phosphate/aromatic aminotransferase/cobyric acid decarboxylase-like protein
VTSGATEAIFASIQAICEPGDEVVLFEPFYDSYAASVRMAGAVPRAVELAPPDWSFDAAALAARVRARTRAILLNTPHNPTGKVLHARELEAIAASVGRRMPSASPTRSTSTSSTTASTSPMARCRACASGRSRSRRSGRPSR